MFDKYGTEGSNEVADTGRIPAHPCETVAHTTNTNEISAGQNCPIDLSSSLRLRLRRRRNAVCGNTALGQGLKDFLLSYVVSHLTESMSDSLSLTSPQRSQTLQQQQHSLLRHRLIQRHQQMLARRRQTSEVQSTCQSNSAPGVSAPICGTHGSVSTGPASFVSSIRVGSSDDLMHFETNRDNIKSVLEAGVGPSDEIYAELERERERESVDQSRFMPNFIRSSPTKMQTVFSPHMGLVTTDEGNSPEPSEEDEELDLNPTAEEEVEEQICRKNLSSIRLPFELDSDSAESADASIDS
ncbi:unnamed protein product [Protopolystoma xenopodis]|uniref:Uncharacterized protein n=1 Tax=Protopolystoma xenopodis TaxID=117903 RepID=A0A3S5APB5_9PLAT|nr:unnamed protein product [Protopolystoma xenopodis]